MSMSIYLLTNSAVSSTSEWQSAIDALEFDVHFLKDESLDAKAASLRVEFQNKPVMLELQKTTQQDLRETFSWVSFPDQIGNISLLRWSMNLKGSAAAYQAAAAYIGMAQGLMIDTEEGKLKTPNEAIVLARKIVAELSVVEETMAKLLADMTVKPRN